MTVQADVVLSFKRQLKNTDLDYQIILCSEDVNTGVQMLDSINFIPTIFF